MTQGLNVRLGAIIPATTPAGTGVARHERGWNFRDRRLDDGWLMIAVLASWLGMQVVHWGAFLFHDAWRHNFPRLYSITKLSGCRDIPRWNGSVDSGWPVIIETISSGITNPIHLAYLYITGCLGLDVTPALFLYKAQILATWLVLAAGTYVLGRTLFRHRLPSAFVFAATLFAGVGLDDLHSDQDGVILFWLPWILTCAVQAHRHRAGRLGALYFNATILFLSLQSLDHYPHFPLVVATVGAALYVLLYPRESWQFVRSQILRMWPAAILIAVTAIQLSIFRDVITGFVASQRGDLIVDLSQNGETGWVQPTVLLTAFLPLSTLSGFDYVANSMRDWLVAHGGLDQTMFVFRPNSLIYYIGFLPAAFCASFAVAPGQRRVKLWWFGLSLIIFAISVQETQISYFLFHLPYFNVFRTYSLFGLFVAYLLLVMSGYGVDAFLNLGSVARAIMVRRSLTAIAVATLTSGLCVGGLLLVHVRPVPADVLADVRLGAAADALIIAAGGILVWIARRSRYVRLWVVGLTAITIVSQVGFAEGTYHFLGMRSNGVLQGYNLDDDDTKPQFAANITDPNAYRRKTCDTFAVCYLSRRDAVSLRLDADGTFLRNPNEPALQEGLATDVVKALDGVSHPVFWFSSTLQSYGTSRELVDDLNAHQHDIGDYLNQVTYAPAADVSELNFAAIPDKPSSVDAHLVSMTRLRDMVRLRYTSSTPAFLNLAISYDPAWRVTVNGAQVQAARAYFNGLLVPVPPGEGDIVVAYRSLSNDFFFYSRYALLIVGGGLAVALAWCVCRDIARVVAPRP